MSREDHRKYDAALQELRKLGSENAKRHPLIDWFTAAGGIGLIAGLVGPVATPYFWRFVTLLYFSLFWLCVDVWIFPRLRKVHVAWRVVTTCVLLGLGLDYAIEVVFLPAPLEIETYARLGNYGKGARIYGKEWKPEWIDLRIKINPPKYDYAELDLQLTPDLFRAAEPWQGTNIPCEPFQELGHLSVQRTPQNPPGPTQEEESIGPTVRMRCAVLRESSTMEIVQPLHNLIPDTIPGDKLKVKTPLPPNVQPSVMIEGPKKFPKWVKVAGTYKVRGRPHEFSLVSKTLCVQ